MRSSSRGFTLLEAIVALAILAAGGMALFAALNSALRSIERADAASRLDTATENAVAWLDALNPMTSPKGEQRMGAYRVTWVAEPVEPVRDNLTDYLQPGLYEVGLYDVRVEIWGGSRVERNFVLRRAGYRQVRQQETP